jgi:nicotinamidase-related amidase
MTDDERAPEAALGAALHLSLRTYQRQLEPGVDCVEANFHYEEWPVTIPAHQAALVLVDVWDTHYIRSHAERTAEIARTKIAPAVAVARAAGIAVIHAPSPAQSKRYPQWTRYATEADARAPVTGRTAPFVEPSAWPPAAFRRREGAYAQFRSPQSPLMKQVADQRLARGIDASVLPAPEDFVVATGDQLHRLCAAQGLLHLFYAGFAANVCISFKDYGIRAMHARGYHTILLRDCTTAIEGHDTVDTLAGTAQAIRELEMADLAATITSEAFVAACAAARAAERVVSAG